MDNYKETDQEQESSLAQRDLDDEMEVSRLNIVGWSAKFQLEWSDKPNKFETLITLNIPDWLAEHIDDWLTEIEGERNAVER